MVHTSLPVRKELNEENGVVILEDCMGNDLSVVNAARVSFGKRKEHLDERDIRLIHYLAEHRHMSPFRHVTFRFILEGVSEVVCRQLYKHQVGCAFTSGWFRETATVWNEMSGRYVEFDPEFVIPTRFRRQHPSNKQASLEGDLVENQEELRQLFTETVQSSYAAYEKLLKAGVAKEQARMVLPICFKNSLVWTASLEAVAHFIHLRQHEGAQLEIRYLARAVEELVRPFVPHSLEAILKSYPKV